MQTTRGAMFPSAWQCPRGSQPAIDQLSFVWWPQFILQDPAVSHASEDGQERTVLLPKNIALLRESGPVLPTRESSGHCKTTSSSPRTIGSQPANMTAAIHSLGARGQRCRRHTPSTSGQTVLLSKQQCSSWRNPKGTSHQQRPSTGVGCTFQDSPFAATFCRCPRMHLWGLSRPHCLGCCSNLSRK